MNAVIHRLWSVLKGSRPALLACLVCLAVPASGLAYDVYQITDSTTNNANIDVAVDTDGQPHAVYDRGGSVYYKKGIGTEELVGVGTRPAIAVGPDGVPQVVYMSGSGQFYVTRAGGAWQTPILISTYNREIDIDVDSNNHAHIAYVAQIDASYPSETSTGVDIGYINTIDGTETEPFSVPIVVYRGTYQNLGGSSYDGNYYDRPRIKIDGAGNYHIIGTYNYYYRYERDVYNYYYMVYKTNSGGGISTQTASRSAAAALTINALALAPGGSPRVAYTQNSVAYYANPNTGTTPAWSEIALTGASTPSLAANATGIGLVYVAGGSVYLDTDTGAGFSAPQLIATTGSAPALGLAPASPFVYYLASDGVNSEVYLQTDVSFVAPPTVTVQPTSLTVTYGEDAVFTTAADGLPEPTVQWQSSIDDGATFNDLDGATATTLTLSAVSMDDNGLVVRAVFTNDQGTATSDSATLTVSPKTLTPTVTVADKSYDGTTAATIESRELTGIINEDEVSLIDGVATFSDKDTGTGKTVTITGLVLAGTDAEKYQLPAGEVTTTADIIAAQLTPAVSVADKTYDGTTGAVIVSRSLTGVIGAEDVSLVNGSAAFVDRNAGTGKTVTVVGLALTGTDAGNYALASTGATTQATISPRPVTVTAAAETRTYDGTTAATGTPTITAGDLVGGDTGAWTQSFDTRHAGTGKTLTPAGAVSDGNGGGNYAVTFAPAASGTISPLPMTVTAVTDSKVYDGTTASDLTPQIAPAPVDGDTAEFQQAFATPDAGTGKTIVPSGAVSDGNGGNNYDLTLIVVSDGVITKAAATVSLSDLSHTYDGTAKAATATTEPAGLGVVLTYNGTATAPTDAGSYTVSAVIDDTNYQGSASDTLVIGKATPVLTWPNPADIVYGTTLGAAQLNATANVPGSFVYTPAAGATLPAGANQPLNVSFTPDDTTNYTTATAQAAITVTQATATVTLGNLSQTYDGTARAATATTEPAGLTVVLTYNGATTAPTNAGSYPVAAVIDDGNYEGTASGTLVIAKATPVLTWAPPAEIVYGTALGAAQLNATASVAGTFVYTPAAGAILNAGENQNLSVSFTPDDTTNYNEATAQVAITVTKATATVTLNNLNQTYDGTAKAATAATDPVGLGVVLTYNGTATVPTDAGSYPVEAVIDDTNYQGSASGTLVIGKATPVLTWANPADIVYGTTLDETQLNATASVAGTFVFNPTAGTLLETSANQPLSVSFTPEDATNYTTATAQVTVNVTQATATVTLADLNQTYDGTARAATATTEPAGLTVVLTYSGESDPPTTAGSYPVTAVIEDPNYKGSANDTLVITKATPALSWAPPSPIVYGTTLGAAQLNAIASIAGAFVYTPAAGATLPAGVNQALSVSFTPDDTTNYTTATTQVAITVTKADQGITFAALPDMEFGDGDIPLSATASSGLPVTFAVTSGPGVLIGSSVHVTAIGTVTVTASQAGDANWNAAPDVAQTFSVLEGHAEIIVDGLTDGVVTKVYDGTAKGLDVTTDPAGLTVVITYDGSTDAPTEIGEYAFEAWVDDPNYSSDDRVTGTLAITEEDFYWPMFMPAILNGQNLAQ
jgi:hypothetical protein